MRLPLISCIMPTTSGSRGVFVEEAVRAFLAQDYAGETELVIVDELAEHEVPFAYHWSGGRVQLVTLRAEPGGQRLSIGAKRNVGIALASGDLICLWDDDDYYGPHRLSAQAAPIVTGEASISGLYMSLLLRTRDMTLWSPSRAVHAALFGAGVRCGTLMFRRELWDASPYPNRSLGEDAAFLKAHLARGQKLARITDPASYICVRHGGNVTDEPDGIEPPDWERVSLDRYLSGEAQRFYRALDGAVESSVAAAAEAEAVTIA